MRYLSKSIFLIFTLTLFVSLIPSAQATYYISKVDGHSDTFSIFYYQTSIDKQKFDDDGNQTDNTADLLSQCATIEHPLLGPTDPHFLAELQQRFANSYYSGMDWQSVIDPGTTYADPYDGYSRVESSGLGQELQTCYWQDDHYGTSWEVYAKVSVSINYTVYYREGHPTPPTTDVTLNGLSPTTPSPLPAVRVDDFGRATGCWQSRGSTDYLTFSTNSSYDCSHIGDRNGTFYYDHYGVVGNHMQTNYAQVKYPLTVTKNDPVKIAWSSYVGVQGIDGANTPMSFAMSNTSWPQSKGNKNDPPASNESNGYRGNQTTELKFDPGTYVFAPKITTTDGVGSDYETLIVLPGPGTDVTCSPATQAVKVGDSASFTAAEGSGQYVWSATGGSPSSGNASSFATTFNSAGSKTVTVSSGGKSADCTVSVSTTAVPTLSVGLTANPNSGNAPLLVKLTATATSATSGPTVVPSTFTPAPGQVVTVVAANGPANRTDWVGLAVVGSPDTSYVSGVWKYLNDSKTAPTTGVTGGTVTLTTPGSGGPYEFRFYANDGYTVLARSAITSTNYTFWWNCDYIGNGVSAATAQCGDPDGIIGNTSGNKFNGVNSDTQDSVMHTYATAGTYTPMVIVERGGLAKQATASVTVNTLPPPSNGPPNATASVSPPSTFCSGPTVNVSWSYSDPDNTPVGTDPQSAYRVQLDTSDSFVTPIYDTNPSGGKIPGSASSLNNISLPNQFNKDIWVQVMVWDSHDHSSNWSAHVKMTGKTTEHAWPSVSFSYADLGNKKVHFTDSSTCYKNGGTDGCASWAWDFDNNGTVDSGTQNPDYTYGTTGDYTAKLSVTDKSGYSCSAASPVQVKKLLPNWKEIVPRF